jgi:tetratricopeptide (TPR) repeat protein
MTRIATAAGAAALIAASLILFTPQQARPAVTVIGAGFAEQCFHAAKDGGDAYAGIADCDRAISGEMLNVHDLAGTYINRGVLNMVVGDYPAARRDFEQSIKLDAALGDAYVNLGAAKIAQRQYADGIADIDHGLTLTPDEPEKAYYNRALAEEALDDVKAAYLDYSKAAELKPNWAAPRLELARFTVQPAP